MLRLWTTCWLSTARASGRQPEAVRAGSTIDGVLYAIPNNADSARAAGFAMNKAVLDELGIDPAGIKTWDDVHDVLVKVKEGRSDLYPWYPPGPTAVCRKSFPTITLVQAVPFWRMYLPTALKW